MRLNGLYQLCASILLFVLFHQLSKTGIFEPIIIIAVMITILNIFTSLFFIDYDNFLYEIVHFFGYATLVSYFLISAIFLSHSENKAFIYPVLIITLVLSPHLRLIKFNPKQKTFSKRNGLFTYNKQPKRNQDFVSEKTIQYPRISNYALYRIEFYLLIILYSYFGYGIISVLSIQYGYPTQFIVFMIAMIIDIVIYLILKMFTNLLTQTAND